MWQISSCRIHVPSILATVCPWKLYSKVFRPANVITSVANPLMYMSGREVLDNSVAANALCMVNMYDISISCNRTNVLAGNAVQTIYRFITSLNKMAVFKLEFNVMKLGCRCTLYKGYRLQTDWSECNGVIMCIDVPLFKGADGPHDDVFCAITVTSYVSWGLVGMGTWCAWNHQQLNHLLMKLRISEP